MSPHLHEIGRPFPVPERSKRCCQRQQQGAAAIILFLVSMDIFIHSTYQMVSASVIAHGDLGPSYGCAVIHHECRTNTRSVALRFMGATNNIFHARYTATALADKVAAIIDLNVEG